MKQALEGVRVIDLSRVLAGPYCTMMMGDLGADVIKVEAPGGSDETRRWGPPYIGSLSAYYLTANRNKRAIALNLKSKEGQTILHELVKGADVVVENWRPGKAIRLGAGYEQLKKINPALVYCSISGFGQDGPYRDLPGYDFVVQAMGGLMSITGEKGGEPLKVGVAVADLFAGFAAFSSILAALRVKEKTGEGQQIDISLLDSQVAMLANVAMNYLVGQKVPERLGNRHPNIVPYQTFEAKDGPFVVAVGNDRQFRRLCEAIGHAEWAEDPRFKTNDGRVRHRDEIVPLLADVFLTKERSYWMKELTCRDIPCGPIHTVEQVFQDPHVLFRQMLVRVRHPEVGDLPLVGSPIKMSRTPVEMKRYPPSVGEHTGDVLREAGFTAEQIAVWKSNGVIGQTAETVEK